MDDDDIDYGISVLLQENATLKRQLADVTAKRDALMDCFFEFETIAPNGELMASVLDMHKRLESLESQLADAQARLAGCEEGYDPATNPPKGRKQVLVKFEDGYAGEPSEFMIVRVNRKGEICDGVERWFPLPGSKGGEA